MLGPLAPEHLLSAVCTHELYVLDERVETTPFTLLSPPRALVGTQETISFLTTPGMLVISKSKLGCFGPLSLCKEDSLFETVLS